MGRTGDDAGEEATTRKAPTPKASDALPLPLYITNVVFFTLFFSITYYLLYHWRDKIRNSTPIPIVTLSEIATIVPLITSFIYLLEYFGIDFVQSFIACASHDSRTLRTMLTRSSRFARLQSIHCSMAGRNLYMRFSCSIGDAMGMNMVSKGVQNVLDFLQNGFSDMDVVGISGKQLAPTHFCCYLLAPPD